MKLPHTTRTPRAGFTLVEMMLVIVIIGILATLISSAVIKALAKAKEVRNRSEISQLAAALETFKQRFGFYPPSKIKICELFTNYDLSVNALGQPNNPLDTDSVQFLTRMFPRINLSFWSTTGINWNGDPFSQNTPFILEGDQCLVFFLGGIPNGFSAQPLSVAPTPACLGFSTNPANPADMTTIDRIGPFYEFQPSRLVPLRNKVVNSGLPSQVRALNPTLDFHDVYFSYLDAYGSTSLYIKPDGRPDAIADGPPYVYFSSYKAANGYNRYFPYAPITDCATVLYVPSYYAPPGLPFLMPTQVWPYVEGFTPGPTPQSPALVRYHKPNGFQIISAGANRFFGSGTPLGTAISWAPATASSFYADGTPGRDDQSNFYDSPLGIEAR